MLSVLRQRNIDHGHQLDTSPTIGASDTFRTGKLITLLREIVTCLIVFHVDNYPVCTLFLSPCLKDMSYF